jgi:small GTP-binding protein
MKSIKEKNEENNNIYTNQDILKNTNNEEDERKTNFSQYNNNRFTEIGEHNNILENPLGFEEPIIENMNNINLEIDKNDKSITQYSFKLIVLGDISVGKTSFINRFIENKFILEHKCTLNAENYRKTIRIDNSTIADLTIWDTAGEERFRAFTKTFYNDAHGAFIMFDITNKNSFNKIESWIKDVQEIAPPDCVIMIIGNKTDLNHNRVIEFNQLRELSEKYKTLFSEVSAKIGSNIALAFEQLTFKIIEKQKEEEKNNNKYKRKNERQSIGLKDYHAEKKEKKCCI